jgi:hypothetical protein
MYVIQATQEARERDTVVANVTNGPYVSTELSSPDDEDVPDVRSIRPGWVKYVSLISR